MTQRVEGENGRKSYGHPCLIAQALDLLGDRWTLLIIRDLMSGLHRYSEILENCSGMSPNVLSDRLKKLEAEGLVTRHYERGLPPRVEYNLTDKGRAVRPVLLSLLDYGRRHLDPEAAADAPLDFAMRVIPTFAFQPSRARGVTAVLAIEVDGCTTCSRWTFHISEGEIRPQRHGPAEVDVTLRTTPDGFRQFVRGEAPPEVCGEVTGRLDLAREVQQCFLPISA